MQGEQYPAERVELNGILSEFRDALEEEIDKIRRSGQSSTILFAGRQIENHGTDRWYRFNVEYAPVLPADTPCKLVVGREQFDVTVISFEENTIIVSAKSPLPDTIARARLENGATVLMERLIKCIEENAGKDNPAGRRMLSDNGAIYPAKKIFEYKDLELKSSNTQSQNNAIIAALSNDITYIWGPPGTGKTTVIGQIIDELYKHNRSVLVVSHTNMAVDGAIEKADEAYSGAKESGNTDYPILRIGIPAKPLPDRVLLAQHVAVMGEELHGKKKALEIQQAQIQRKINEIIPLLAKAEWLEQSELELIREKLQLAAEQKKTILELQCEIKEINIAMQREKAAHPEYSKFLLLSKAIKEKQTNYNTICEQACNAEITVNELPQQIRRVQDEIKKHNVYAELREKESEFMSEQFFRNELAVICARIFSLRSELSSLIENQAEARQTIENYEKKSSIAKMLIGKGTVTQAQRTLSNASIRIPQLNEKLQHQYNLEKEYNCQLENLLMLQEQIKAVVPSETREYWEVELRLLQSNYDKAKEALPSFNYEKSALYEELCVLEQQQMQAKSSFDIINEYGRALRQKRELLKKMEACYIRENDICTKLLEKERLLSRVLIRQ